MAASELASMGELHPVVARVLASRGFSSAASVERFLARDPGNDDPFLIPGMHEAVRRLRQAAGRKEHVVVYGDFDADGVTATALLMEALAGLGASVSSYIPHRSREGYGLHAAALERLAADGAGLVITVDCGIRATEALATAADAGLDVIVTDHHAAGAELPAAAAVVSPALAGSRYEHTELAAVGLAYKVAQALAAEHGQARPGGPGSSPAGHRGLADLLDLVAIGTVADVVPLVGENRALVHRGLSVLRSGTRPGLVALTRAAGADPEAIDARTIGFVLAPRLNAAGRMDDADIALRLLLARQMKEAWALARRLDDLNTERRSATRGAVRRAERWMADHAEDGFLLYADPSVPLGVAGLVSARLAETFHRPAAVVRTDGDLARGSVRSVPGFDVLAALDSVSDLLVRFGGHAMAAGFTARTENLDRIGARLAAAARAQLAGGDRRPELRIDAELTADGFGWALHGALERLRPFGEGNPRPVLMLRDAVVATPRVVGSDHLKFVVECGPGGGSVDAIAFGQGGRLGAVAAEGRADLAFSLRANRWRGRTNLELHVADMAPPHHEVAVASHGEAGGARR